MTRAILLAALLAAGLPAAPATASVWDVAIARGKPDPAQDKYESELRAGDEHALLANTHSSYKEVKNQVELAIASYKAAAAAKPKEGEPYFRLGKLLYSFYFDCSDPYAKAQASLLCDSTNRSFSTAQKKRAEEVIAAWDAFEQRSPLDPRLSVGAFGDNEILFERAILHTKIGTKDHLKAAARDYEKILARYDGADINERVLGNLAETYMMVGRLEEAIETYREALRGASDTSTWYGYAVALDRDENTRQALEIIKSLGRDQRELFHLQVTVRGTTFFVPDGEKYYYFALADEAFGADEEAIDNWRRFINSGAHPEFHPRAKAHLDALTSKKKRKTLHIEPWPELFR